MNHYLLATSYFLHLAGTVVWIGGMTLMVLVVWPLQQHHDQWRPFLDEIDRRFRPFANFSLLLLLVTGVVQTGQDDHYGGLLQFDNTWSLAILGKHIAFGGMVAIVIWLQFGLEPALERARLLAKKRDTETEIGPLQARTRRLSQVNFVLGMVVLIFTAIATAT